MKFFLSILLFSFGLSAQTTYPTNDGMSAPETFNSKNAKATPVTSESGVTNAAGVTTDQMNTSPNQPPTSEEEVLRDSTLSSGEIWETGPYAPYAREGIFNPRHPEEIEAQEENALDYSTTPKKRTTTPSAPNKK